MRKRSFSRSFVQAFVLAAAAAIAHGACSESAASRKLGAAMQATLNGNAIASATPEVWSDVRTFYEQRAGAAAWVKPRSPSRRALAALHVLRRAPEHGLKADAYGEAELARTIDELERSKRNARDLQERLAHLDVKLTAAMLAI